MAEPVKYTFDQAFDGGEKSRYDDKVSKLQAEMEAAKQQAYQQGLSEGKQQALAEIEAATLNTLSGLSGTVQSLYDQHNQIEAKMKHDMVQLAYTIASKLAPALIEREPLHELETLITECMQTVNNEPRLVLRVSEQLLDNMSTRMDDLKKMANFNGDVVVVAENSLGLQDCTLEWAEGGTTKRYGEIQKQIENTVQKYIMGLSGSNKGPSDETASERADSSTISENTPEPNTMGIE
jgi:flagellar assembly protein FliH